MKVVPILALLIVGGVAAYFAFGRTPAAPEQPLKPTPAADTAAPTAPRTELSQPATPARQEASAPRPAPVVKPKPVPAPGETEWQAEFKGMTPEERVERHTKLRAMLDERLQAAFDVKMAENQVQVVSGGLEEDPRAVAERQAGPGQLGWAVRRDIDKERGVGNYWFARIDPSEDPEFQALYEQVDWLARQGGASPR